MVDHGNGNEILFITHWSYWVDKELKTKDSFVFVPLISKNPTLLVYYASVITSEGQKLNAETEKSKASDYFAIVFTIKNF